MNTIQVKVEGMTCQGCVRTVKTILENQEGVANAQVDLSTKMADIDYDEAKISVEEMKAKIGAMGYNLVM